MTMNGRPRTKKDLNGSDRQRRPRNNIDVITNIQEARKKKLTSTKSSRDSPLRSQATHTPDYSSDYTTYTEVEIGRHSKRRCRDNLENDPRTDPRDALSRSKSRSTYHSKEYSSTPEAESDYYLRYPDYERSIIDHPEDQYSEYENATYCDYSSPEPCDNHPQEEDNIYNQSYTYDEGTTSQVSQEAYDPQPTNSSHKITNKPPRKVVQIGNMSYQSKPFGSIYDVGIEASFNGDRKKFFDAILRNPLTLGKRKKRRWWTPFDFGGPNLFR